MSHIPPRPIPALSYQVECAGCGAPTAHHEHSCSFCTRPTGRHVQRERRPFPACPKDQQPTLHEELIEITCIDDRYPVFIPAQPQPDRR